MGRRSKGGPPERNASAIGKLRRVVEASLGSGRLTRFSRGLIMTEPGASVAQNVASLMQEVALRHPEKPALVFESSGKRQSISFGELWRQSAAFASHVESLGLRAGDRAIVMIPMSIDLYVCLLGMIQMGGVVVFVDPWIGARQIARFSEFAEPHAFIGINKSHLLRWSSRRLRKIGISVTNGFRLGPFLARHSLSSMKRVRPATNVSAVSPDDSALITFTSGSSGMPKGANRTHRFLLSQHRALQREFPYDSNDIDMPMFPVFALNNLVTGITSIIPEMDFRQVSDVDGDRILKQMVRSNVTTCTASPPFLDNLAEALRDAPAAVKSKVKLRRILTGGAPVRDGQLRKWIDVFQTSDRSTDIIVAYGSTEAEPVGHISAQQRIELSSVGKGFCTGRPTDLIQTMIIPIVTGPVELSNRRVDQIALSIGEIGELVVAGDHVCREYYKNEDATSEHKLVEKNGKTWHRMGDTGYFDSAGRFWLVGRVHSTIFRGGQQIHPQIVEQVVGSLYPESKQVAAIGYDHAELGELVVVVIVVAGDAESGAEEIKSVVRKGLTKVNLPCDFVLVTESSLPVDPRHNSKIDYPAAKRKLPSTLEPQWPVNV